MGRRAGESGVSEGDWEQLLTDIARARMPFGKYGPEHYPPAGVPIYDLPYPYLAWFERTGFPDGRLGEMLRFVYLIKRDGADAMFDPLREHAGGRTNLRPKTERHWDFADTEDNQ